jgi:choline dehydrogenase-like flavoprotein
MIRQWTDFAKSPKDVTEHADVCVIGSGCGGASLAARLAEAGKSVVIVEQGGYYTKDDFDQRELDMLAKLDGARGLATSADGSVALTYGHNVGGASVHYWADSYRTPADRLKLWQEEFGLEAHDEAALNPHFDQIEKDLHVFLATDRYVNRMNQLVKQAADVLGWRAARVPQARKGCIASGYCLQGCAYDAKQSQLVTYIPRALDHGARLYADARAERLVVDRSKVTRLEAAIVERGTGAALGPRLNVEARAFVVAAGGYGTPDFLLRQGLKKRLPALGEHFFCNPCPMMHARFDEDIVQWRNIPAAWGVEHFRVAEYDGTPKIFGRPGAGRYMQGGYLLMANQLQPGLLAALLPGFGRSHDELMRELPKLGGVISWIDDAEEGSIDIEDGRRRVHVPLTGENENRIRDAWYKQARLLLAAGAREVIFGDAADTRIHHGGEIQAAVRRIDLGPSRNVFAAPHPGGAARMGADPKTSVVDFDHRVHGTDNLFVADPSVLPTPPSVDPSLTILAFSFVAADRVQSMLD